jgi:hypothetical protein
MKSTTLGGLLLGAALLAGAPVASASTFTYSSYSVTNEQSINIFTPNNVSGGAGEIVLTGSGANAGHTIVAWCLDIYDFLTNSGTYNVGVLTTSGSGGANPTLTTTQIGEIGALMAHGESLINTSHDVSAAIQLAIWEIEYGSAFTSNGITPSVSTLAATYVTDVKNGTWAPDSNVSLLSLRGDQTLGFLTPLPASWLMMLSVLAGLGFIAFRRQKHGPAAAAA